METLAKFSGREGWGSKGAGRRQPDPKRAIKTATQGTCATIAPLAIAASPTATVLNVLLPRFLMGNSLVAAHPLATTSAV